MILGTAAYMAPEQARGKTIDRRVDFWAFGCVFFEMLSGRRPFDGETVTDVLSAILTREPAWSALPGICRRPCCESSGARWSRTRASGSETSAKRAWHSRTQRTRPNRAPHVRCFAGRRGWSRFWQRPPRWGWGSPGVASGAVAACRGDAIRRRACRARCHALPGVCPAVALSANGRTLAFVATTDGIDRVYVRSKDAVAVRPIPAARAVRTLRCRLMVGGSRSSPMQRFERPLSTARRRR